MRRVICFLVLAMMLSGCATYPKFLQLKEEGKNMVVVRIKGDIEEAKDIIREVAIDLNFIERSNAERDNFMTVSRNYLNSTMRTLFLGYGGNIADKLGFFLEYDSVSDVTTVTVVEEVGHFVMPTREFFVDRIKLGQFES